MIDLLSVLDLRHPKQLAPVLLDSIESGVPRHHHDFVDEIVQSVNQALSIVVVRRQGDGGGAGWSNKFG